MAVGEILLVKLGARLAKFLLKTYLKEPGEAVGAELVDIAKGKIEGYLDRQEAKRQFERIGERIAAQLLPFFQAETLPHEVNAEAVGDQLARTMEGNISAEFFLARDLDAAKLIAELRRVRPLPQGQFSPAEVGLYDRTLAQAVRYIVEVAAKLPRFEVTQVKESLQRLTRIEDVVGETAKGVKRIEAWVAFQEGDVESRQYEIDYRLAVARNLDFLELFGADLTPESKRQALSVAYVSLTLETSVGSEGEAEPAPVETVLAGLTKGSGRLLIRGEAGSGKSTLFRWAAIQAAQGLSLVLASPKRIGRDYKWIEENLHKVMQVGDLDLESPSRRLNWRGRLPFLLRLRDCKGGKLPPPNAFPELIAKEIGSPPSALIRAILQSNRGLLLFDGIDEIPNLHRETVKREIEAIIGAYPNNFFLVSTRPEAVPTGWLGAFGFSEARVNPMSDLDRSRFIDKWHEAVATELSRVGRPAGDLPRLAEELKRQLPENPSVARLATNPLLCAMICALHRDRSQKLPERHSQLCEALCEALLHRRERESELDLSKFPEPYRSLDYQQKRFIVQDIAHWMVLNGESTVTVDRAQKKVAEALRSLAGQSEEDAEVICQALVERSGMLRETKPGYLDFIHNTFKEYLAGDRFGSSGDVGLLAEHVLDPTWQRVILFSVATTRGGFANEVIRRLLEPAAAEPPGKAGKIREEKTQIDNHLLRARQLLALQCRAAALLVDPNLEVKLDEILCTMFPPKSMGDAEALAASGEIAVPFLTYRDGLKAEEAATCVRALRLIGTQRAQTVLEGYFDERRGMVVSELCQAVNPLSLKAIQEKVIAGDHLADGIRSQISDLSPLSGLSSLQRLVLRGTQVSDVSSLSGLSSLRTLDLSATHVSDVSPLSRLSSLHVLDLTGTRVSDVSPLSGLSTLQGLFLGGAPVSDISPLSGLSSLEVLYLSGAPVSNVSPLSGLSNLHKLELSGTLVSDLSPLAGLSSLPELHLSSTPVSDVSPLAGLSSLQTLELSGTPVSDVSPLSGLSSLRWLILSDTRVSDISPLSGLSSLQRLDLIGTPVSDVSPLSGLSSLRWLILSDTQVSDISPLSRLSSLQVLDLTGTPVSDVSPLSGLPHLKISR